MAASTGNEMPFGDRDDRPRRSTLITVPNGRLTTSGLQQVADGLDLHQLEFELKLGAAGIIATEVGGSE